MSHSTLNSKFNRNRGASGGHGDSKINSKNSNSSKAGLVSRRTMSPNTEAGHLNGNTPAKPSAPPGFDPKPTPNVRRKSNTPNAWENSNRSSWSSRLGSKENSNPRNNESPVTSRQNSNNQRGNYDRQHTSSNHHHSNSHHPSSSVSSHSSHTPTSNGPAHLSSNGYHNNTHYSSSNTVPSPHSNSPHTSQNQPTSHRTQNQNHPTQNPHNNPSSGHTSQNTNSYSGSQNQSRNQNTCTGPSHGHSSFKPYPHNKPHHSSSHSYHRGSFSKQSSYDGHYEAKATLPANKPATTVVEMPPMQEMTRLLERQKWETMQLPGQTEESKQELIREAIRDYERLESAKKPTTLTNSKPNTNRGCVVHKIEETVGTMEHMKTFKALDLDAHRIDLILAKRRQQQRSESQSANSKPVTKSGSYQSKSSHYK